MDIIFFFLRPKNFFSISLMIFMLWMCLLHQLLKLMQYFVSTTNNTVVYTK